MDADVKLMVALTYIYTDVIWRLASNDEWYKNCVETNFIVDTPVFSGLDVSSMPAENNWHKDLLP